MTNETKKCPFCGEEILVAAKKCKHCGEWLDKVESNETKDCPICGETISANSATCEHCGESLLNKKETPGKNANTEKFPDELKKFNWGAFLTGWIWGLGNNVRIALWTLIGLLSFIPVLGILVAFAVFAFQIWLGINGNKLAWESKQWNSIEQFNDVQKKWAMWSAIVVVGIPFVISFVISFVYSFSQAFNSASMGY